MKKWILLVVTLCMIFTGCSNSSKAFTFNVETGDEIKVKLDTTDGKYDLVPEGSRFSIMDNDNEIIAQGIFILPEYYDSYVAAAVEYEHITGEKDGNTYILYQYVDDTHTENNYVIDIVDADTAVIIASVADKTIVQEIFELLTISVDVD